MADDRVIPFDPNRRRRGLPPPPAPSRARDLARQQTHDQRARYERAQARQETERLLRDRRPVPARITLALDVGGFEGPEVDVACGAVEPAVDLWECGAETHTAGQVKLLAALTGFPVSYFYMPVEPGPQLGSQGAMWICATGGCRSPEPNWVDEHGVLHYGGEPPRTPPAAVRSWRGHPLGG